MSKELSPSGDSDVLDHTVFDQLLEMDDDEDREFSKSIVTNFFEQAGTTFQSLEKALQERHLAELSSLGHFLKGSSAALGLNKVKDSCEKIQHYGAGKSADGTKAISDKEALDKIEKILVQVKKEYREAEAYLKKYVDIENPTDDRFYGESS